MNKWKSVNILWQIWSHLNCVYSNVVVAAVTVAVVTVVVDGDHEYTGRANKKYPPTISCR